MRSSVADGLTVAAESFTTIAGPVYGQVYRGVAYAE